MYRGWRIKEELGKEKMGPKLREVPQPAGGKFGKLGPTKNAPERDSVYERQVAIRIRGGTE